MKRPFSIILAILMLLSSVMGYSSPTVTAEASELTLSNLPDHVIINQVYGGSDKTDGAISNSFIELYNPTDNSINLNTYSIQYAKGTKDWNVLELTGKSIAARSSFLILCVVPNVSVESPRCTISNYDLLWSQKIDNDAINVALVSNKNQLSAAITDEEKAGVIDLVGAIQSASAGNIVYNYEGSAPVEGISKQKSARRIMFSDSDDNKADFEILDYRTSGISDNKLQEVKPRYSGDGPWGVDIEPGDDVPDDQKLKFSHEAGLYYQPFLLILTTGYENGIIRYTTDGKDPTASSPEYTRSILMEERTDDANVLSASTNIWNYTPPSKKVFKGNVIKAQVFSQSGISLTDVYTKSYFVNANYGNLAVISLVTDKDNFFHNDTGIYANGNYLNKGADWERPLHFELFEPDGSMAVSQNMGVRIHGGATRNLAQKSLRLYAKKGYDAEHPTVEYDLFEGRAKTADQEVLTSFKRFLLRNSGNDNSSTLIRDALLQSLLHDTNVMIQAYRQSVVFINGEFWGIYNIRERIDDESVMRKYKLDDAAEVGIITLDYGCNNVPEDYDTTDPGMVADYEAYMEMWNWFNSTESLVLEEDYLKAQTFIDIDNFIDYYIAEVFVNNTDWPGNNNAFCRYRTDYPTDAKAITKNDWKDGRWRWMLKDTDFGFGQADGSASTNSLTRLKQTSGLNDFNPLWSTLFFRRLITNEEFNEKFVNRFCDLLNTNFKPDIITSKIDDMAVSISGIIDEQNDRWYSIGGFNSWTNNINAMKSYADRRVTYIPAHLKTFFSLPDTTTTVKLITNPDRGYIKINDIDITTDTDGVTDPSSWSGTYFTNKTQTISAIPYKGYKFSKFIVRSADSEPESEPESEYESESELEYDMDTINITLTDETTIQAQFVVDDTIVPDPDPLYITVVAGTGGSVTGGGTYEHGTNAALTAVPKEGYRFVRWLEGAEQVSDKYQYTFTVDKDRTLTAEFAKIGTPASMKVKSAGYKSLKVSWNKVPGAVKYEIYRAAKKKGNYTKIRTVAAISVTDTKLVTGRVYYYKVRAVCVTGSKTTNGDYSKTVGAKPILSKATGLKAKKISATGSKLSWKKVTGATGFEVRRATGKKGKYKKVTNTRRTSYTDKKLVRGKTYYYKVRAYRLVNGKKVYGQFSKVLKVKK